MSAANIVPTYPAKAIAMTKKPRSAALPGDPPLRGARALDILSNAMRINALTERLFRTATFRSDWIRFDRSKRSAAAATASPSSNVVF
jgi:hypothetical protein